MVAKNLDTVRSRIERACSRSGRPPGEVTLVAVSKSFDAGLIEKALSLGHRDFGESYVQELSAKRNRIPDQFVRWHFIGGHQSNKVKALIGFVHLIHSLDRVEVARELQKRAEHADRTVDVLLEVHTTSEATKSGVAPDAAMELARHIAKFDRVNIRGLMTMGPFSDNPEDSRPSFRALARLRDHIRQEDIHGVSMEHLSMGMSGDFEVGIEEGSTIVRIGTAIFGQRLKSNEG